MTTVTSIAGNNGFSKVFNHDLEPQTLLAGVAGTVAALTVPAGAGALPVAVPVGADITLTDAMLQSMVNPGFLRVDASEMKAAHSLFLGADSAARATQLLALLGISGSVTSRLVKFDQVGGVNDAFALNLASTAATANNVQVSISGGAVSFSQILDVASTSGSAYMVVSKGVPATAGEACILFNIIGQGLA